MPPTVGTHDIGPGLVFEKEGWKVTAAPAVHVQPWLDSLAYRLDSPEGSVVFTGDTQPCDTVIELAKGADVMLCMCWDDQSIMNENGEDVGQCGTTGAAEMAQAAGVKKLVLSHMGPHLSKHGPLEKGIGDVRGIFKGEIVFAEELMSFEV
jgi:ribonuclease BN (tRNA processing enzyme)